MKAAHKWMKTALLVDHEGSQFETNSTNTESNPNLIQSATSDVEQYSSPRSEAQPTEPQQQQQSEPPKNEYSYNYASYFSAAAPVTKDEPKVEVAPVVEDPRDKLGLYLAAIRRNH